MMSRPQFLSLFCLLLSFDNAASSSFSNLMYSLKLCSEPGTFCGEPDCANGSTNYLCQWYDCTATDNSDRRYLKSSNSTCTFFGSQASCGGDSKCLAVCSHLNDGYCPECISSYEFEREEEHGEEHEEEECMDLEVFTPALEISSSSSSQTRRRRRGFSLPTNVSLSHGLLVFLFGMGALVAVLRQPNRTKSPMEEKLVSAVEGLVKKRMNAVKAGNADGFSTAENQTHFKPTNPSIAYA